MPTLEREDTLKTEDIRDYRDLRPWMLRLVVKKLRSAGGAALIDFSKVPGSWIKHWNRREPLVRRDPVSAYERLVDGIQKDDPDTWKELTYRLGTEFCRAAEQGDDAVVKDFIDQGFPVNFQEPVTGQTVLHIAAACRARAVLRLLVANIDCNFLIRDKQGRLSSEMAYLYGHDPAAARLLAIKERKQAKTLGIKLTRRPRTAP